MSEENKFQRGGVTPEQEDILEKVTGGTGNDENPDFLYDFIQNNCQRCSKAMRAAYDPTAPYCDPMSKYGAVHGDGNARCPDIC